MAKQARQRREPKRARQRLKAGGHHSANQVRAFMRPRRFGKPWYWCALHGGLFRAAHFDAAHFRLVASETAAPERISA